MRKFKFYMEEVSNDGSEFEGCIWNWWGSKG